MTKSFFGQRLALQDTLSIASRKVAARPGGGDAEKEKPFNGIKDEEPNGSLRRKGMAMGMSMSICNEARRSIKHVVRDALRERWQPLLRFTAPAALITAGSFVILRSLAPDLSGGLPSVSGVSLSAYFENLAENAWSLSAVYFLRFVLELLLYGPLTMCLAAFFLPRSSPAALNAERDLLRDAPPPVLPSAAENFAWFREPKRMTRALLLRLAFCGLRLLIRVLMLAPGVLLLWFTLRQGVRPAHYGSYYAAAAYRSARLSAGLVLLVSGFIGSEIRCAAYRAAPFILAQEPDMKIGDALRESRAIMRHRGLEYIIFSLSFLPWLVFCVVTLGVGLVYVLPYRVTCEAAFVRYADAYGEWRMFERGGEKSG